MLKRIAINGSVIAAVIAGIVALNYYDPKRRAAERYQAAVRDAQILAAEEEAESLSLQDSMNPQLALENQQAGAAFREEYAQREGVTELDSGLLYRVIEEGDGPGPGPDDRVRVHYTGSLIDGKVFDDSRSRGSPAEFRVGGVIDGWSEALQLMKTGARWEIVIPPDLGYGRRGMLGTIPPEATLVFDVTLLEVLGGQGEPSPDESTPEA